MTFYSIYYQDQYNNFQLICGAGSRELAEEALKKHPGYENAEVVWQSNLIYGQVAQTPVQMGFVKNDSNIRDNRF